MSKAGMFGMQDHGRDAVMSVMDREEIIRLLSLDEALEEAKDVREKAHTLSLKIRTGQARLWGAMGIDFVKCPISCDFCSFGEKWDIVKEDKVYSYDEIKRQMQEFVDAGVYYIVVRTTEYYSIDDLCEKVRRLRSDVKGRYEIILNIGEFGYEEACQMYEAGVFGIYHAVRLREGVDTGLDPDVRNATMTAVEKSPLKLISLVEPIGPEHTNEEIADDFLNILRHKAYITGVMARFPIPRDSKLIESDWKRFTAEKAKTLFEKNGYCISAERG